jgi:hypothetical protein
LWFWVKKPGPNKNIRPGKFHLSHTIQLKCLS